MENQLLSSKFKYRPMWGKINRMLLNGIDLSLIVSHQHAEPEPETDECYVNTMCSAVGKNIIATAGSDKILKIWSYSEGWTCSIQENLHQVPRSVTIHPIGLQVAVGLEQELRVFFLLEDSLTLILSAPKKCEQVAYSECGGFLAVGHSNCIEIYCPYTFARLAILSPLPGITLSIHWVNAYLYASCSQGSIYAWSLQTSVPEKALHFSSHGILVKSCIYDDELDQLAIISRDGSLRIYSEYGNALQHEFLEYGCECMALSRDYRVIAIGMKTGSIRLMLWPIVDYKDSNGTILHAPEWMEVNAHVKSVRCLTFLENMDLLVSCGDDGKVNFYNCKQIRKGKECIEVNAENLIEQLKKRKLAKSTQILTLNELSIVSLSKLELQAEQIDNLEEAVRNMEHDRFELERREKQSEQELRDITEQYDALIKTAKDSTQHYDNLLQAERSRHELKSKEMKEKHDIKLLQKQEANNARLNEMYERYDNLKKSIDELKQKFDTDMEQILKSHNENIDSVQNEFQNRLNTIENAYAELEKVIKEESFKYEAMVTQTDNDYENLVKQERQDKLQELKKEKTLAKNFMMAHSKLVRDNMTTQKDCSQLKEKKAELVEKNSVLKREKRSIEMKLEEMEREMERKEDVIKKKENAIKELRSLHVHLQNFRFVLDQKIKALKDERQPMENQLNSLQTHIKSLFGELLEEESTKSEQNKKKQLLEKKISDVLQDNSILRDKMLKARYKSELFRKELGALLEMSDEVELIKQLKSLYMKYVGEEDLQPKVNKTQTFKDIYLQNRKVDTQNVKDEISLQNNKLKKLHNQMSKDKEFYEESKVIEMRYRQHENNLLIEECNNLRNEKIALDRMRAHLEGEIKQLKFASKSGVPIKDQQKVAKPKANPTPYQELKMIQDKERARFTFKTQEKPKPKPDFRIRNVLTEFEKKFDSGKKSLVPKITHSTVEVDTEDLHDTRGLKTPSTALNSMMSIPKGSMEFDSVVIQESVDEMS